MRPSVSPSRARQASPELAVLLVTGYADAQAIKDLVKSEAVLRKPFKVSDLAIAVRKVLEETGRADVPSA